jgi:hypothetical protein
MYQINSKESIFTELLRAIESFGTWNLHQWQHFRDAAALHNAQ